MSHTNLLYHMVFATKERAPLIPEVLRSRLHEYLGGLVRGLDGVALEVKGMQVRDAVAELEKRLTLSDYEQGEFRGGGRKSCRERDPVRRNTPSKRTCMFLN